MKVLITGATSGIGNRFLKEYSQCGYQLVAVGRNEEKLNKIKEEFHCQTIAVDLSIIENCYKLYDEVRDIDIFINNAGFGYCGKFIENDLNKEIAMINTNVIAMHILFKLYLADMVKKNSGTILNVGSIAGFMPGPEMAAYYATKAYVNRITQAVNIELANQKSAVYVAVLCPGPVETEFFHRAGGRTGKMAVSSKFVVEYALEQMKKKKSVIIPDYKIRFVKFSSRIVTDRFMGKMACKIQNKRTDD